MANQITIDKETFSVGSTIRVHQKIQEKDKTRIQVFEGIVISIKGSGENKMFTVRKIAMGGIGVERIWPALSPWIERVEVKKRGMVRRAKLYYLRKRTGKRAVKVKLKREKPSAKTNKSDGRVKGGKDRVKLDEEKKPRTARREIRRQVPQKE